MKKLLVLILALIMFCACGVTEEPEIPEETENLLGEDSRILKDCIYKSADEKYGVHRDGAVLIEAEYDVFETVGQIGGKTFYALGKTEGTKPYLVWNDDGITTGTGETEKILYDIFDSEGIMLLSFPVDDFVRYDKETLFVSSSGSFYSYTFSDEGVITEEKTSLSGFSL